MPRSAPTPVMTTVRCVLLMGFLLEAGRGGGRKLERVRGFRKPRAAVAESIILTG